MSRRRALAGATISRHPLRGIGIAGFAATGEGISREGLVAPSGGDEEGEHRSMSDAGSAERAARKERIQARGITSANEGRPLTSLPGEIKRTE
jgi:hypothetical protein